MEEKTENPDFDKLRRRVMWLIPNGIFLLGTRHEDQMNLMTLSWMTQVSSEPKVVIISCEKRSLSFELISKSKNFSVSFLEKNNKKPSLIFAKPAVLDKTLNTLSQYEYFEAKLTKTPVLSSACAYMEFGAVDFKELDSHVVVYGEVLNAVELFDGSNKITKESILSMQDTKMNYGG
jgi:flavin reductase (DIM6/NTAB) family NADH-FMN oxidoreductase RutF